MSDVPLEIPPTPFEHEGALDTVKNYRSAPFIIQAACAGEIESYKYLANAGSDATEEVGHICFSKRMRNSVVSNVVGAAAYWGNAPLLSFILGMLPGECVDLPTTETSDRRLTKSAPFQAELQGYTPLMLAIISPHSKLACVKSLLSHHAKYTVKDQSTGNTSLHLAAEKCANDEVFEYLFNNVKVDVFVRNNSGHTPLSLCEESIYKSQKRLDVIKEVQKLFDNTDQVTNDFMAQLEAEEDKNEKAKQKKKDKKHRSKLLKLAEKRGCTVEELEQ